jgi:hypothetical protein
MTVARSIAVGLVVATLFGGHGAAEQVRDQARAATDGTGVLSGMVTTADESRQPIRRAILTLSGGSLTVGLLAVTDDAGRFVFRNLPVGRFTLQARKSGFVTEVYGAVSLGSTTGVPIAVNNDTTDVAVVLVRSAAITGRVVLPPAASTGDIRLQVLRRTSVGGRVELLPRGGAYGVAGDGQFRIGGLTPGEYVLVAYPFRPVAYQLFDAEGTGGVVGYAPVYWPGTTEQRQAGAIRLEPGDTRMLEVALEYVETGRLSGRVMGIDGVPMAGVQVTARTESATFGMPLQATTGSDGAFVMPRMVPGAYTLIARGTPGGLPAAAPSVLAVGPVRPLWAETHATVTPGRVGHVGEMHLRMGVAVRGRVVISGADTQTGGNVPGFVVTLHPRDVSASTIGLAPGEPGADGVFVIPGVAPGAYEVRASTMAQTSPWSVIGISHGDRDVLDGVVDVGLDRDVEVTIKVTSTPSVVAVTVQQPDGRAAAGQPVVVFPVEPARRSVPSRRVLLVRAGADGVIDVRALPDGEYLVAALAEVPVESALTAEWFDSLAAGATKVNVRDGHHVAVTVTTAR